MYAAAKLLRESRDAAVAERLAASRRYILIIMIPPPPRKTHSHAVEDIDNEFQQLEVLGKTFKITHFCIEIISFICYCFLVPNKIDRE